MTEKLPKHPIKPSDELKKCTIKRTGDDIDYCGLCPDVMGFYYYESFDDFNSGKDDLLKEEAYCNFFIYQIKLTKEEWENIPDWCPLPDIKE